MPGNKVEATASYKDHGAIEKKKNYANAKPYFKIQGISRVKFTEFIEQKKAICYIRNAGNHGGSIKQFCPFPDTVKCFFPVLVEFEIE
jgi:hypothetical protein